MFDNKFIVVEKRAWPGPVQDAVRRIARSEHRHRSALSCAEAEIDYASFYEVGLWLAYVLETRNVGKGDRVSIVADRDARLPCAILGVLQCGGVFHVIDSSYPAERINALLSIVNPKLVIAWDGTADNVATRQPTLVLPALPEMLRQAAGVRHIERRLCVDQCDPACITFTSGSGGVPVGVVGGHGGLSAFLPWFVDRFDLSATDVFSMLSGLAHDPIQRDIFTAWWVGGTLAVPPRSIFSRAGKLASWLNDAAITVSNQTPSVMNLIVEHAARELTLARLRRVFTVGERLLIRDVRSARRLFPNAVFVNLYGATETQRALTYYMVEENQVADPIPLGHAPPGLTTTIRDENDHVVPAGESGTICFHSDFLALGYLNKADNRDFIGDASGRAYRTGDRGYLDRNGVLYFSGRRDRQVNVRGYRVELAEIEHTALTKCRFKKAYAKWWPEQEKIVLYVEADDAISGSHQGPALRAMASVLPTYMLPNCIVFMDRLPLNANGKIDGSALSLV